MKKKIGPTCRKLVLFYLILGGRWLWSLNKWCEEQNRLHPFIILTRIFCKIDKTLLHPCKRKNNFKSQYWNLLEITIYYLLKNCCWKMLHVLNDGRFSSYFTFWSRRLRLFWKHVIFGSSEYYSILQLLDVNIEVIVKRWRIVNTFIPSSKTANPKTVILNIIDI